jgi:catechol 2,3-dioxygenase-like lactoylglutathione lyase family enzyme
MRRTLTMILGVTAAAWCIGAQADSSVLAVRLGAKDAATLAKFYDAAFGLKQIDKVVDKDGATTEVIMRYGTSAAAAKAGSSPEFLVAKREGGDTPGSMAHAIFHVSDINATVAAAKAAGATMKGEVGSVTIGGAPIKIATMTDPDGNVLEIMELPKGTDHLPHP